jgi:hypothetical protein
MVAADTLELELSAYNLPSICKAVQADLGSGLGEVSNKEMHVKFSVQFKLMVCLQEKKLIIIAIYSITNLVM